MLSNYVDTDDDQQQQREQYALVQQTIEQLLKEYNVSIEYGLSSDDVMVRREQLVNESNSINDDGYNTIDPPIKCPQWICCLLPCIYHIPSMKLYATIQPDDTLVKRNGQYIRYDATALIPGDIIRLEEGDIIPADCIILQFDNSNTNANNIELLVDHRYVCEDENTTVSVKRQNQSTTGTTTPSQQQLLPTTITTLYYGGRIILGSVIAIVIAIGNSTNVGQLIRHKKFPPISTSKKDMLNLISGGYNVINTTSDDDIEVSTINNNTDEHTVGVALLQRQTSRGGGSGSNRSTPQKLRPLE